MSARQLPIVAAAAAALGASGAGIAATLGVTAARLTSYAAAGTVPTSTCTLNPVADAYVDSNSKASNFGTATTVKVQAASGATKPMRSFLRFNVAGCVPANAAIVSATLGLYLRTAPLLSRTYEVATASAAWTESGGGGITWNNQPGVSTTPTASVATGITSGVQLQWNVAADVQAFADGTAANNGWRVADSAEGSAVTYTGTLDSREGTNRPVLSISYWP